MIVLLCLRLSLQLDVSFGEFHREFNPLASVLLANLFGLFLNEGGEGIQISGHALSRLFLGCNQRVVEALHLLALGLVYMMQGKRLRSGRRRCRRRMTQPVDRIVLRLVLHFGPYSLHRKKRVLRAAIAFFADAGFLAPQIAVNRIALRHFVVAVALREAHASAVGKLPQQREYLPLDVGGRALGRITEKHFVFDLQPTQLGFEYVYFFIGGHGESPVNSVLRMNLDREVPGGHRRTWYESKLLALSLLALSSNLNLGILL